MPASITQSRWLQAILLAGGLAVFAALGVWLTTHWSSISASPPAESANILPANTDSFTRVDENTLTATADAVKRAAVKTAKVSKPEKPMALPPFQGNLALDINTMVQVRALFGGKVISLGQIEDPDETPSLRPIRQFDTVKGGALLATIWSKDLGEKKSEFVDALTQLHTDEKTLKRLEELYDKSGGTSERSPRDAEQTAKSDKVALEKAERTLRSWELSDSQINTLRTEADKLLLPDAKDPRKDFAEWAKVEIRAAHDGIILEKNINAGDIVDTSTLLFKIGDLSNLMVWMHLYEEDLRLLKELPRPTPWNVRLISQPVGKERESKPNGYLQTIGPVIDPLQRTALVTGKVANPNGELKIGQAVTATVEVPVEKDILIVPTEAVVEDGRRSVVLILTGDESQPRFTRKPVEVVRRFFDVIQVRWTKDGVQPNDLVVTAGALLLQDALEQMSVSNKK